MSAAAIRAPHVLAGALCAGLGAALVMPVHGYVLGLAAGGLALAGPLLRRPHRLVALALALALAGAWWGTGRLDALGASTLAPRRGDAGLARVEVTGPVRAGRFALRVPVRVRSFDGRTVDEPARLELPLGRAPPQGAILQVVATIELPRPAEEAGGFDEAAYLRRQGVHVVLEAGFYRVLGRRGGALGLVDRLREHLARSIAPGLDGERRALVAGVVLGEDDRLSEPLRDDFRASGLYHVLAVSGQNVAYVILGTLLLAWLAGLPRWAGHLAALGGVLGYTCAVGWQPSVVRAGIAGSLASLAWLASRPADRWYFLLLGACVLLAVNPYSLLEPGFQLSFAAVAAIFVLVPQLERRVQRYRIPKPLADAVVVSAACGLVTAPILWLQFGTVPVYAVLANALGAPVVAPLLGLALACATLEPFVPSAAAALAWGNGWLAAYLAWCARTVADLPHARVSSGGVLVLTAAAAGVVALAVRLRPERRRVLVTATAVLALAAGGWKVWLGDGVQASPPAGLRVTFLDVGQGDGILLQVPEGAVLVDGGPPEAQVANQLERLGVHRLEALVLTHPQRDHVGGAADVLDELSVGAVLDPGLPAESPDEEAALAAAARRRVRIVAARAGLRLRLGRLGIRVVWPDGAGAPGQDPNEHAVVLIASYGETDVLLTADAESNVTLSLRLPPVEILKVAHHGSADDGLPDLLRRTRPRIAVISCGERNDYGHPTPTTLAALDAAPGLATYRTDEDGAVTVESDGRSLTVASDS